MADFNQFGAGDDENAEIKKLTIEVVRTRTQTPPHQAGSRCMRRSLAYPIMCCCRRPIPITSILGRSSFAPASRKKEV